MVFDMDVSKLDLISVDFVWVSEIQRYCCVSQMTSSVIFQPRQGAIMCDNPPSGMAHVHITFVRPTIPKQSVNLWNPLNLSHIFASKDCHEFMDYV